MGIDTHLIIEFKRKNGKWKCANRVRKTRYEDYIRVPFLAMRRIIQRDEKYAHGWDDLPDDLTKDTIECLEVIAAKPIYIKEMDEFRLIWWYC